MSQGVAAAGERSLCHRGNVKFLLKLNLKLVPDHHGLSILRVGEGEFDGEFEGNSREFDAGFGEFDVFSMLAEL